MIDSIGPNKARSIQKLKRVQSGNSNSTTSESSKKVTAESSGEHSAKDERKGSIIDEQV